VSIFCTLCHDQHEDPDVRKRHDRSVVTCVVFAVIKLFLLVCFGHYAHLLLCVSVDCLDGYNTDLADCSVHCVDYIVFLNKNLVYHGETVQCI